MSEITRILTKLGKARSVDEGDEYADELAKAAKKNAGEVIDLYYKSEKDSMVLVWCLQGIKTNAVINLFKDALKHKNQYVRWAAIEGLKHSTSPTLIPVFVDALKDRSHLVKMIAVEWIKKHGDSTAIAPLEHLIKLPSLASSGPGIVQEAKDAIVLISKTPAVRKSAQKPS